MDSNIIEVQGASYSVGRLSAKKQFHVARRLGPFIGSITPHLKEIMAYFPQDGAERKPLVMEELFDLASRVVPSVAEILAEMDDESCDYIIDACLMVARRQQSTGWAPVSPQPGVLMFPDIDMVAMLQITAEVIQANLSSFFHTAGAAVSGAAPAK